MVRVAFLPPAALVPGRRVTPGNRPVPTPICGLDTIVGRTMIAAQPDPSCEQLSILGGAAMRPCFIFLVVFATLLLPGEAVAQDVTPGPSPSVALT